MIIGHSEKSDNAFTSQIPNDVWRDVFHNQLDTNHIPRREKNFNQITRDDLPKDEVQAFIILMIRYPDVSAVDLIEFLYDKDKLNFNSSQNSSGGFDYRNRHFFKMAAAMGRLDILKWLKYYSMGPIGNPDDIAKYQARWDALGSKRLGGAAFSDMDKAVWLLKEYAKTSHHTLVPSRAKRLLSGHSGKTFGAEINQIIEAYVKARHQDSVQDSFTQIEQDSDTSNAQSLFNAVFNVLKASKKDCSTTGSLASALFIIAKNTRVNPFDYGQYFDLDKHVARLDPFTIAFRTDGRFRVWFPHILSGHSLETIAAQEGHLDVLEWLLEQAPDDTLGMFQANDYQAFRLAAANGHLPILKWLVEQAPDDALAMIQANDYQAFRTAAERGRLDILQWLIEQAPNDALAMIQANDYEAFRRADRNNHVDVVNWLLGSPGGLAYAEQHVREYGERYVNPFIEATLITLRQARETHLDAHPNAVFDIEDAARAEHCFYMLRNLIRRNDRTLDGDIRFLLDIPAVKALAHQSVGEDGTPNELLSLAMNTGNVEASILLLNIEAVRCLGQSSEYQVFRLAAGYGHLEILKLLVKQAPDDALAMIQAGYYDSFRLASNEGHLHIVKWLVEQAPNDASAMIKAHGYEALEWASRKGNLHMLKWVAEKAPIQFFEVIQRGAHGYGPFYLAPANGHLDILKWLFEQVPDKKLEMIRNFDYMIFCFAANSGHLHILKWLIEQAPDDALAMIQANRDEPFRHAAQENYVDVVNWLLEWPACLVYAEQHVGEYGERYVNPFIDATLITLRQARETHLEAHPNAVFDIEDAARAEHCFYMLRNLIRRNDRTLDDDIRFLLDIPAVKALAHQRVGENGRPNELLRLAMSRGNVQASTLLLNIEAVRTLAEADNYYQRERRTGVDLAALARNRESSMTALTSGEQARLNKAIKHYTPIIEAAGGASKLLDALRDALIERYEASPAFVMDGTKKITLPTRWEDFNALNLSPDLRQTALHAYYNNKAHTALRYLSKPNRWMADNVSYVYVDEDDHSARYSTFEEYTPLIVMLWLGAKDKEIKPIDGHTFEGRLEHFIDELAHIGRAHNWDRTREKRDEGGNIVIDPDRNQPVREEYDDLAGDRPSCFSGVKRRLFQSVVGHPFFTVLTEGIMGEEVNGFAYQHFKKAYSSAKHKGAYEAAYEAIIMSDEIPEAAYTTLSELNIPQANINAFIDEMKNKYGEQAHAFTAQIHRRFVLPAPEENAKPEQRKTHLFNFFYAANLQQLIDKLNTKKPGLFSAPDTSSSDERAAEAPKEHSKKPPSSGMS